MSLSDKLQELQDTYGHDVNIKGLLLAFKKLLRQRNKHLDSLMFPQSIRSIAERENQELLNILNGEGTNTILSSGGGVRLAAS